MLINSNIVNRKSLRCNREKAMQLKLNTLLEHGSLRNVKYINNYYNYC